MGFPAAGVHLRDDANQPWSGASHTHKNYGAEHYKVTIHIVFLKTLYASFYSQRELFCALLAEDQLLSPMEHKILLDLFDRCLDLEGYKPDLYLYLQVPPREALGRVRGRQRLGEEAVSLEYLQRKNSCLFWCAL